MARRRAGPGLLGITRIPSTTIAWSDSAVLHAEAFTTRRCGDVAVLVDVAPVDQGAGADA